MGQAGAVPYIALVLRQAGKDGTKQRLMHHVLSLMPCYAQVSAPELPAGTQTPPQTTSARSAVYSRGEPPAVQMQGLVTLQRDAEGPSKGCSAAQPGHAQAEHVLPESTPVPLDNSPVGDLALE